MNMQYAYLNWSLLLLGCWGILFVARPRFHRKMWIMSLGTAPLGLSEPLFYPEY